MPDQNHRPILSRQHTLRRSDRFGQCCQRVLDGRCIEPRRLQSRNHFGPARSVGEKSVDENDVSSWRVALGAQRATCERSGSADCESGSEPTTIHHGLLL